MNFNKTLFSTLIATGMLSACGGGSSSKTPAPSPNVAPKVSVSAPAVRLALSNVSLSANISDADNNLASQKWEQTSGPETVNLTNSTNAVASFIAPQQSGDYSFAMTATDSQGLTTTEEVTVTIGQLEDLLPAKLQEIFDKQYAQGKSLITNMAMSVNFYAEDYLWQQASGVVGFQGSDEMTPEDQYRIASSSKTFTAVVIMKLVEQGTLSLDTTLAELFSGTNLFGDYTVEDLHVTNGVKRGGEITVEQLLNHTSGLADYLSYLSDEQSPDSQNFLAVLSSADNTANKMWTGPELIINLLDRGLGNTPHNLPGEGYVYTDTNYVLLGLIIEELRQTPLAQVYREMIFTPLAMESSYLEWANDKVGDGPVEHYYTFEDGSNETIPINASGVNLSFDWAGGGIVSNVVDLDRFFTALAKGEVFNNQTTALQMQNWVDVGSVQNQYYGLGVARIDVGNLTTIGHGGYWGSDMFVIEDYDIVIVTWENNNAASTEIDYIVDLTSYLDEIGYSID